MRTLFQTVRIPAYMNIRSLRIRIAIAWVLLSVIGCYEERSDEPGPRRNTTAGQAQAPNNKLSLVASTKNTDIDIERADQVLRGIGIMAIFQGSVFAGIMVRSEDVLPAKKALLEAYQEGRIKFLFTEENVSPAIPKK